MRIAAKCHPERENSGRGLCGACHSKARRKGLIGPEEIACAGCGRNFMADVPTRAKYCSEACAKFCRGRRKSLARGDAQDDYFTWHEWPEVKSLIERLRFDGLQKVGPRTNRYSMRGEPYWTAWRRDTQPGFYLYIVRYWYGFPQESREENDDEELAA